MMVTKNQVDSVCSKIARDHFNHKCCIYLYLFLPLKYWPSVSKWTKSGSLI